jgi:hypothetical protein
LRNLKVELRSVHWRLHRPSMLLSFFAGTATWSTGHAGT